MGQRLIINLWSDGEVLANGYYHWGAFSTQSLRVLKHIIEGLRKPEEQDYKPTVFGAVKLLQLTGAELPDAELDEFRKTYPDFQRNTDIISRNDGLISVSDEGKKESIFWGEGSIEINLDEKTFDFDVCFGVKDLEELKSYYGLRDDELPTFIESSFKSFEDIPFDRFEELVELINRTENEETIIKMPDGSYVGIIY